ncbi:MAG: hypothetical protein KGJ73_11115, partial [Rhodospirillales bacterium]|nr:hypothetical protein [Rhodospirillales bacterium]
PVALSGCEAVENAWAPAKRISLLALVLLVPLLTAQIRGAASSSSMGKTYPSCSLHDIAPLLAPVTRKVVLAPVEDTPELLYRTHVFTVGALYQHGISGFMRDRAAWRSTPGARESAAVTVTKASYVLLCPAPGRYPLVADLPATTLWDALDNGTPPPWLKAVGHNKDGWTLYKIVP